MVMFPGNQWKVATKGHTTITVIFTVAQQNITMQLNFRPDVEVILDFYDVMKIKCKCVSMVCPLSKKHNMLCFHCIALLSLLKSQTGV